MVRTKINFFRMECGFTIEKSPKTMNDTGKFCRIDNMSFRIRLEGNRAGIMQMNCCKGIKHPVSTIWHTYLVERECEKLENAPAWHLTIINEASCKGRKVHFASLVDLCRKKAEFPISKVESYLDGTLRQMIQNNTQHSLNNYHQYCR